MPAVEANAAITPSGVMPQHQPCTVVPLWWPGRPEWRSCNRFVAGAALDWSLGVATPIGVTLIDTAEIDVRAGATPVLVGVASYTGSGASARGTLAEEGAADDVLHDLDGAASDPGHSGVDEGAGDRVLGHITPATEQLKALVHDPAL